MLAPRYLYFFCFASLAAPGRFTSVFFRWLGLGDEQIGLVMALPTILSIASALLGGLFADSSTDGKRKTMLLGTAASAVFFLGILGAARFPASAGAARLAAIAACFTLSKAARYPSMSALDAYTLEFLVARFGKEAKQRYGEERLWGAVSWGIVSIAIGLALDHVGFYSLFVFNFVASMALVVSLLDLPGFDVVSESGEGRSSLVATEEDSSGESLLDAFQLDDGEDWGEDWGGERCSLDGAEAGGMAGAGVAVDDVPGLEDEDEQEQTFSEFMRFLFSHMDSLAFLFTMTCLSVGTVLVEGLYFLYLDNIGSSHTLLGISVAVTVIFEIPLFFYGDALSNRFSGRSLMLMGMAFYVVRVLYYTLITDPWMVLLVEPLHGVTFSFVQMAAVLEMSRLAPPNLQTTAQSVLSVARMVGSVIGTVGGGIVMEKAGAPTAYRAAAVLIAASALFYAWTTKESARATPRGSENELEASQEVLLSEA